MVLPGESFVAGVKVLLPSPRVDPEALNDSSPQAAGVVPLVVKVVEGQATEMRLRCLAKRRRAVRKWG